MGVFFLLLYKLCQSYHWEICMLCYQSTFNLVASLINLMSYWMVVSVACGKNEAVSDPLVSLFSYLKEILSGDFLSKELCTSH